MNLSHGRKKGKKADRDLIEDCGDRDRLSGQSRAIFIELHRSLMFRNELNGPDNVHLSTPFLVAIVWK